MGINLSGTCEECGVRVPSEGKRLHVDWHVEQEQRYNDLLGVLKTITSSASTMKAVREIEQRRSISRAQGGL